MFKVKILFTEFVTHDVKRFVVEKPSDYEFVPGQATEVAISKSGWEGKKRPFTFTSLNEDLILEFTIKGYPVDKFPNHRGVTEKLHTLVPGDELIIEEPWGTINYQGAGIFIAGGAGITPFIAIFRQLRKEDKLSGNRLIFSNKRVQDIILEKEFREIFAEDELFFTLTRQEADGYYHGRVDKKFIQGHITDFSQDFYVCGPPVMVKDITAVLEDLGAKSESIVFEE